jgi:hypothetical protein
MNKKDGLELKLNKPQITQMKVGAQILEHLSKGIYSNPAYAIKELINNAYDAEAKNVIIRAKPEFDTFSITDDGEGLNYKEFSDRFVWISRSDRRDKGEFTENLKRPIIGKFGIGFIAVSEICNKMKIISSKENENYKFEAEIDFGKFRKSLPKEKQFYELSEVKFINKPEEKEEHYTMIILTDLSKGFRELLEDKERKEKGIALVDFDGKTFEEIIDEIEKNKLDASKDIGRYWQLMLQIANIVPVEYLNNGPIKVPSKDVGSLKTINEIKNYVKSLNFSVDFDGVYLKKPILLPNEEEIKNLGEEFQIYSFKEKFSFDDKSKLYFRGYIYNQKQMIKPPQLQGIILRIKNVAIMMDPNFLEYPYAEKLFIPWNFGEIYIEEGLEEALNINRNSFRITHPHYRKIENYLHDLLHNKVFIDCRVRWDERKENKHKIEEEIRKENVKSYLNSEFRKSFKIEYNDTQSKYPIEIDLENNRLFINKNNPIYRKFKKKDRNFLEDILIRFETSYKKSEGNVEKLKSIFLEGLAKWKK